MNNTPINRRDRLIKEKSHHVFRDRTKLSEPSICTDCGAVYSGGRWLWLEEPPAKAEKTRCAACQRIASNYPAGYIQLRGDFLRSHQDEIMNLIHNVEKTEKNSYPMERIIKIQVLDEMVEVTTTGVHVARRIGEALARAYQGDFSFQYGEDEKLIRVYWAR